jgi:UDP-N-acetylmuramoyl-L-alanyl-D-glutamate--2,6-diaminopimelate ligase
MDTLLHQIKKLIPKKMFNFFQPLYHFVLAVTGTIIYRFPSRHIHVVAITGTKGKSSTTEYVNAVLEAAGYKTAVLSTIRFKIGDLTRPNMYKMTMPGRFFVQKFLREAVDAGCQYAVVEMTSEGARLSRHIGVSLDTLIFTNLTPEHIESHGSFENYKKAKLKLVRSLAKSWKPMRRVIANISDPHGASFLIYDVNQNIGYKKEDAAKIEISLPGDFNKMNALAAYTYGKSIGINDETLHSALLHVIDIPGRAQEINVGQGFRVVVDYAHTVDSLEKIYGAYSGKKIAILGATGGGRDKSKRVGLGKTADENCDVVIVTDEDPYDDNVMEIINTVASGVTKKTLGENLFIEIDRRKAIAQALPIAQEMLKTNYDVTVIISGKGTDPYIMRAEGKKEKWSDAQVAKEEIEKYLSHKNENKNESTSDTI